MQDFPAALYTQILKIRKASFLKWCAKGINGNAHSFLAALRETFADRLVDPDFRLMMEFQLEALRNDQLRLAYKGFHQEMVCDALKIIEDIRISSSQISFKMKPADVILAMLSYSQGIAIKQTLLSPLLSRRAVRAITLSVFDSLVSWRSEEQM
jgi:hypothetical protein